MWEGRGCEGGGAWRLFVGSGCKGGGGDRETAGWEKWSGFQGEKKREDNTIKT